MDWNNASLLLIAALNAATAFLTWRTHDAIGVVKLDVAETKNNISTVEKATNSMKDALVAATAKASQAAGELKGRADQIQEGRKERNF